MPVVDPRQLHARAEVFSLAAVWPVLELARQHAITEAASGDRGALQAWRPGTGGSGAVANPVLNAIERDPYGRAMAAVVRVADGAAGIVRWLAGHLSVSAPDVPSSLAAMRERVMAMDPSGALEVARWIAEADRAVRTHLGMGDDHVLLTGVRCPACRARRLAVRASAPAPVDQVVVCEACVCAGLGCHCGRAGRVPDVRHVWSRVELEAR